jgi:hypothetical protein
MTPSWSGVQHDTAFVASLAHQSRRLTHARCITLMKLCPSSPLACKPPETYAAGHLLMRRMIAVFSAVFLGIGTIPYLSNKHCVVTGTTDCLGGLWLVNTAGAGVVNSGGDSRHSALCADDARFDASIPKVPCDLNIGTPIWCAVIHDRLDPSSVQSCISHAVRSAIFVTGYPSCADAVKFCIHGLRG